MTEQERAAALADRVMATGFYGLTNLCGNECVNAINITVAALRAYARPSPADLRMAAREAMLKHLNDCAAIDFAVDAVLALMPQTQAASDDAPATFDMALAGMGEWDRQHKAGVRGWTEMLTAVYGAMRAARLGRAAGKEG